MRLRNCGRRMLPFSLAALAALLAASCAPARRVKKPLTAAESQQSAESKAKAGAQGPEAAYTPGVDVTEASLRGAEFAAVPGLAPIYFDYDSASLKDASLEALKKNARQLKEQPDMEVLIAGFCDERGTVEYNLALGQKRAKEVREYYIRLGVPGKSIATISYGKESPVCGESSEDCWGKNRRAETRVRARTAANGPTAQPAAQ